MLRPCTGQYDAHTSLAPVSSCPKRCRTGAAPCLSGDALVNAAESNVLYVSIKYRLDLLRFLAGREVICNGNSNDCLLYQSPKALLNVQQNRDRGATTQRLHLTPCSAPYVLKDDNYDVKINPLHFCRRFDIKRIFDAMMVFLNKRHERAALARLLSPSCSAPGRQGIQSRCPRR